MPVTPAAAVIVWTDDRSAAGAARLLDLMGKAVEPVGVGGPRTAAVHDLAKRHRIEPEDDLRRLIVRHPAAWVLLASGLNVAADDVALATQQGSTVLALEPVITDWEDLPALSKAAGRIVFVPSFTACPGWVSAADPAELLGTPRMLAFDSAGGAEEGSVFARLFDAWRTLLRFTELPETIDAARSAGEGGNDPRAVTGHVTAHARLPNGSAVVCVSDLAYPRGRRLRVVGDGGSLIIDDTGYELCDVAGKRVDARPSADTAPSHAELAAVQWRRRLDQPPTGAAAAEEHDELRRTLACCLATTLSTHTRQPENPTLLMSMR